MDFRELFLKVSKREEMRIYEPNRDCLIWETFRNPHSLYTLSRNIDKGTIDWTEYDDLYFKGKTERSRFTPLDPQTELFLEKYGEYEVIAIECGDCETGSCLDVFICPYDVTRSRGCEFCHHSIIVDDNSVYRGWSCAPDNEDSECKKCWRNLNERNVKPADNTSNYTSDESCTKEERSNEAIREAVEEALGF